MESVMRYPSPDRRYKVRGPLQVVKAEDGSVVETRRLHIFTSRFGRHTTKIAPASRGVRALTHTTEGAEAQ